MSATGLQKLAFVLLILLQLGVATGLLGGF
ncbi:hypothetical protein RISW2_19700 [Roseivivax isoporae LMG 25204]|uniref:Uncharacterized protein n=1 Tax=Roseivivax isoporae LMG 25204 TaxID=1449351 RepID=X7FBF9_9RHOB|nr:hypothetical protein RISW2_19700 [Roseivivax isoporae LMG 25204]